MIKNEFFKKNIKLFEQNMFLIGSILLLSLLFLYSKYFIEPINDSDLKIVKGTIKKNPSIGEQGGEAQHFSIDININEDNKDYSIMGCSYEMSKQKKILDLKPGDTIIFQIKMNSLYKKNINIFSLYSKNEYLLTLENVNKCYTNQWRVTIPIIFLLIVFFIFRLLLHFSIIKGKTWAKLNRFLSLTK
jgi:hypothetical protein